MRLRPSPSRHDAGFTLMEMAVVLAIIGLLVGAVVGGQELLKQSEMQTVISDYNKYTSAVGQFRQQYGSLPGDIIDATNFWGDDTTSTPAGERCSDATVTDGNPGTCNGNGNGSMADGYEPFRAWQQLTLAKYLTGSYTGIQNGAVSLGTNVPRSRVQNSGWTFGNNTSVAGTGNWFNQDLSNYLDFGAPNGTVTDGAAISPSDAWQVDKKVDDGAPNTGKVIVMKPSYASVANCATTSVEATTQYKRTYTGIACHLYMGLGIM